MHMWVVVVFVVKDIFVGVGGFFVGVGGFFVGVGGFFVVACW